MAARPSNTRNTGPVTMPIGAPANRSNEEDEYPHFLQVFFEHAPTIELSPKITTYKGLPAVIFSREEAAELCKVYDYWLVGQFPYGRPLIADIIKSFADQFKLEGIVRIGPLDANHVYLKFSDTTDCTDIVAKTQVLVNDIPMRLFRWSSNFNGDAETPLAAIWVLFPQLPVQYFLYHWALMRICRAIGRPIKMDAATENFTRPSVAKVKVEVDLLEPLPNRVWIYTVDKEGRVIKGFWQKVAYEKIPEYCTSRLRQGHNATACRGGWETEEEAKVEPHQIQQTETESSAQAQISDGIHHRTRRQIMVAWRRPEDFPFKLNTDGSSRGNPRQARAGGLVRDAAGQFIHGYALPFGNKTSDEAEAYAIWAGLNWFKTNDFSSFIIETDSQFPVKCISGNCEAPLRVFPWVSRIHTLCGNARIHIQHCYREANRPADALAKLGASRGSDLWISSVDDLPAAICDLLALDASGVPWCRFR